MSNKLLISTIPTGVARGDPQFADLLFRVGENMNLYADVQKIYGTLGWIVKVSLNKGLERTISSYKEIFHA